MHYSNEKPNSKECFGGFKQSITELSSIQIYAQSHKSLIFEHRDNAEFRNTLNNTNSIASDYSKKV